MAAVAAVAITGREGEGFGNGVGDAEAVGDGVWRKR